MVGHLPRFVGYKPLAFQALDQSWLLTVKLARIMSDIFHYIRTLYSTHTNNTYRCHKVTALAKDVTSNLLVRETYDCISNEPGLTLTFLVQIVIRGSQDALEEVELLLLGVVEELLPVEPVQLVRRHYLENNLFIFKLRKRMYYPCTRLQILGHAYLK